MRVMKIRAYAKINLALDVVSKRADGYHELDMIMAPITLHDLIYIDRIEKGIEITSNNYRMPTDERNIMYQVAKILIDRYHIQFGVKIHIFKHIPTQDELDLSKDASYLHICANNTIYGTEWKYVPETNGVPIIADMSSNILSKPVDVSKYGMIYAGAQKNLAPAGVTLAIVRVDALGHVDRPIPTMLNYATHIKKDSMFNTPPVLPIYAALQTLKWYKEQGGIAAMEKKDLENAAILYDEIDRNKLFRGTVAEEDRSIMNVCFVMNDEYKELEDEFSKYATAAGMVGIKGHRSVGGFRASLYNGLEMESVQALIKAMQDFEKKH